MYRHQLDAYAMNRLLPDIQPDPRASLRVAEKCGLTKAATAREAWFNTGKWIDVEVWTLTRAESNARHAEAGA